MLKKTIFLKKTRSKTKSLISKNHYIRYISIILLLLLVSLVYYPNLFVFITKNNQTLSAHFLLPGEGFSLTYNHSVEKTPVQEIYHARFNGGFIMNKTIFQSYGAGLPLENKNFSIADNKFIIDDMNIDLDELRIRVSRTPGQIVKINKMKYDLQEISKPGELIIIKSGSLFDYIQFRKLPY